MLTLLINESNPLDGLFANATTGGIGSVPDISVADEGQAVSVQSFTRTGGIITDSFVAGDVLHIGIGDGVNAPVCYVALSSASPATGTMPINTTGMVALFAATVANQLQLTVGVVRTRGGSTNTIFSAPIVIHRSVIDPDTAVPTPSILGTGVYAALQVAINTALGFVRLDASARLPAVDGSQLTNLAGGSLTVGTTAIASGTTTRVLFDNAGILGEYTISGTGSVAMTTSPSFTTPDLDTPSALVGTNITGTASGLTAGNATLAATVTVANEATDTTCFPLFATAATGSLAAKSNAGMTFNSATGLLSATGLAGAFNGTVGATTQATGTFTSITVTSGTTSGAFGERAATSGVFFKGSDLFSTYESINIAPALFDGAAGKSISILYNYDGGSNWTAALKATNVAGGIGAATLSLMPAGGTVACGGAVTATSFAGAGTGLTGTAASLTAGNATKWTTARTIALTGDVTYTSGSLDGSGNVTGVATLANIPAISGANLTALNASNISSGTLAAARMANAGVHTGDATGTFPAITLNAAQTGITSVGTLTGGATGAGFTVALSTSTITGTLADARLSANVPLLNAANTFTAANIFSAKPLTLSGNQSAAAWTTTGTGLVLAGASLTDTTSSGTVAVTTVHNTAAPTLLASSATTYTDSFVHRMAGPPVASTNVTQTRAHTLGILDSTSAYRNPAAGAFVVANAFGVTSNSVSIGAGNIAMTGELAIGAGGVLGLLLSANSIGSYGGASTIRIDASPFNVASSSNGSSIAFSVTTQATSGFGYLTVSQVSATACALTATGADSNISINVVPKGSGVTNLNGTGAAVAGTLAVTGATTLSGDVNLSKTITAAATTGAQTINKNSGAVNFAAAATSLVVTNSLCTVNSVVTATIGTNDATASGVKVVPAAGSFTIYLGVAPTAETRVYFLLTN